MMPRPINEEVHKAVTQERHVGAGSDLDVFKVVKQNVTARQAAELYGLQVKHNGMACCPFHDDKTPSMKMDERYYCFGCHASGDAIDLVAGLFQISKLEAAKQIADDFRLDYDRRSRGSRRKPMTTEQKKVLEMRQQQKEFRTWRSKALSDLNGDYRLLTEMAEAFAPIDRDVPFSPRFVQAFKDRDTVLFYIDLLENTPKDAQINMYLDEKDAIEKLHRRITHVEQKRSSVRIKLKEKMKQLQSSDNSPKVAERHKAIALWEG